MLREVQRNGFCCTRVNGAMQCVSLLLCSSLLYSFHAGKMGAAAMDRCIWSHHMMCVQPHNCTHRNPNHTDVHSGACLFWCVTHQPGERCSEAPGEISLYFSQHSTASKADRESPSVCVFIALLFPVDPKVLP